MKDFTDLDHLEVILEYALVVRAPSDLGCVDLSLSAKRLLEAGCIPPDRRPAEILAELLSKAYAVDAQRAVAARDQRRPLVFIADWLLRNGVVLHRDLTPNLYQRRISDLAQVPIR